MKKLTIPFDPMPAPRPRFSRHGTYNPKKYTDYKNNVAELAKNVFPLSDKAIKVSAIFYMRIPKSWSKKNRLDAVGRWHIKKPDSDNLLKTVKDALNGIAYKDDSQVALTITQKIYDDEPRTEVWISELEENKKD